MNWGDCSNCKCFSHRVRSNSSSNSNSNSMVVEVEGRGRVLVQIRVHLVETEEEGQRIKRISGHNQGKEFVDIFFFPFIQDRDSKYTRLVPKKQKPL